MLQGLRRIRKAFDRDNNEANEKGLTDVSYVPLSIRTFSTC